MEGVTAKWYSSLTRKALDEFVALARRVAEKTLARKPIAGIRAGAGILRDRTGEIGGYRITAIDISQTFVEIAGRNALEAGVAVDFRHGDAAHMPFEPESFDFVLCRAAFKNFSRPVRGLEEMYRVLRPGGRALIDRMRLGRLGQTQHSHYEIDFPVYAAQTSLHTKRI